MSEHFPAAEVEDVLDGRFGSKRTQEVVEHLIRGCAVCRAALKGRCATGGLDLTPALSAAYGIAFERAADAVQRAEALPSRERPRFRKALSLLSSGKGVLALTRDGDMRMTGLGVYEALLARSWAVRFDDPAQMWQLAKAALEVAKSLDPRKLGARKVLDLQARAWGEVANAYRANDRLQEAEEAFGEAFSLLVQGTGDLLLRARLQDLKASLLGTLGHYDLALGSFEHLPALYQEAGEPHLAGKILITAALYTFYSGLPHEALQLNGEGLALIDPDREPALVLMAFKNQLLYLTEIGDFRRAKKLLFENRPRFASAGRITKVKIRAIEGRISYGMGEIKSAELIFREVKQGFKEAGLCFASAISALDVGLTLLRQRRVDEAEKEVREASAVFVSLKMHNEILASVLLLEDTFRLREASVVFMEVIIRYIRLKAVELGVG